MEHSEECSQNPRIFSGYSGLNWDISGILYALCEATTEAENECLFTWEDVDELIKEEYEKRYFSKIKIDSEKFIDYIKDLPERK